MVELTESAHGGVIEGGFFTDGDASMEESLHLALMSCLLIHHLLLYLAELLLQSSETDGGRIEDVG